MYALPAAIHLNRSRAWTYCCYIASSLGTHALAIRRSQENSRSAGLSGYAWSQPAGQPKLVVPSQPFIDTLFSRINAHKCRTPSVPAAAGATRGVAEGAACVSARCTSVCAGSALLAPTCLVTFPPPLGGPSAPPAWVSVSLPLAPTCRASRVVPGWSLRSCNTPRLASTDPWWIPGI